MLSYKTSKKVGYAMTCVFTVAFFVGCQQVGVWKGDWHNGHNYWNNDDIASPVELYKQRQALREERRRARTRATQQDSNGTSVAPQ
ncbi:MAG: hypothetical protein MHM6MM_001757 [Cercozoa sp. M6MM]